MALNPDANREHGRRVHGNLPKEVDTATIAEATAIRAFSNPLSVSLRGR